MQDKFLEARRSVTSSKRNIEQPISKLQISNELSKAKSEINLIPSLCARKKWVNPTFASNVPLGTENTRDNGMLFISNFKLTRKFY